MLERTTANATFPKLDMFDLLGHRTRGACAGVAKLAKRHHSRTDEDPRKVSLLQRQRPGRSRLTRHFRHGHETATPIIPV